jgi:polyphosphate kinase
MSEIGEVVPAPEAAAAVRPAVVSPGADARIPLFDRELSWIEFNRRVLGEAESESVPLLDRVKFLSIASHNLDEFLMIRVGEVRDLIAALGNGAAELNRGKLDSIRKRTRRLLNDMYGCLSEQLLPALQREGIRIDRVANAGKRDRAALEETFATDLEPVLTPLAIDPAHPFPHIANLALNLALELESARGETHVVLVRVPESSPRLLPLAEQGTYVLVEDVIASHVQRFFPGLRLKNTVAFRVIRNSDLSIKEEEVQDLLKSVETELRRRARREVVWLEVESGSDERLVGFLVERMQLSPDDVFVAPGPLKLSDLMQLYNDIKQPKLKEPPFNPRIPAQLASAEDIFSIIRRGDVLLHRPYDSFTAVIEFVQTAAEDPDVVAIKQTLYRVDSGSPIIDALAKAAERGKQVTAVIELQARFDEKKNIDWARHLEEAGVQVVYGLFGIKTHCKMCLVVRRESDRLRRYLHLSTGNYNAVTGRLYTDFDLFTYSADFAADAAQLMNLLTGFSSAGMQELIEQTNGSPLAWRRFIVAPMDYQRWTIAMIEREEANAREGKPARITAKMNALVDPATIAALYRASSAGVKIDLLVRGICCLVPGVPGTSENIQVLSVVDRFLEHGRVFRFENGGKPEIYVSSGDWMPRNFARRVEVTFPIRSESIIARFEQQILPISLSDNVKSWTLDSEGVYHRRKPDGVPVRSQEQFIAIARSEAIPVGPYDEILRQPGSFRRKAKKKKK